MLQLLEFPFTTPEGLFSIGGGGYWGIVGSTAVGAGAVPDDALLAFTGAIEAAVTCVTPLSLINAGSFAFSAAEANELFVGDRDDEAEEEEPADHDLIVRQCNTGRTSRQN